MKSLRIFLFGEKRGAKTQGVGVFSGKEGVVCVCVGRVWEASLPLSPNPSHITHSFLLLLLWCVGRKEKAQPEGGVCAR